MPEREDLIQLHQACRTYARGSHPVQALKNVNLSVSPGEFIAVTGPSGSGKSTLLHILGCIEKLTSGCYYLNGDDVGALSDDELAALRAQKIGFIFQAFHLLPALNVMENMILPCSYHKSVDFIPEVKAAGLLEQVGLAHRCDHFPHELSGGEMQRVAIGRALMGDPAMVLADEPTGNLDQATSEEVLTIFQTLHRQQGKTIILVTHDPEVASLAQRRVTMRDGSIV